MPVDLNKLAEQLKKQRAIGVDRDGRLSDQTPNSDVNLSQNNPNGNTTLEPKRFFDA